MTRKFEIGQTVVWRHVLRGGYGYSILVDVTVVQIGSKKVLVEAPLARGGTKRIWVKPDNLIEEHRQ